MRWLDSTSNYVNMSWSKLWDTVEDGVAWCAAGLRRNRYILAIEQLNYYHNVLAVMFRNYELYDACLIPQSCLTLCELMGSSPSGSSVRGDSPDKNTGVGLHASSRGSSPLRD